MLLLLLVVFSQLSRGGEVGRMVESPTAPPDDLSFLVQERQMLRLNMDPPQILLSHFKSPILVFVGVHKCRVRSDGLFSYLAREVRAGS